MLSLHLIYSKAIKEILILKEKEDMKCNTGTEYSLQKFDHEMALPSMGGTTLDRII